MFSCGECGKPITMFKEGDVTIRTCVHLSAPIVAEMTARLEGRGGLR